MDIDFFSRHVLAQLIGVDRLPKSSFLFDDGHGQRTYHHEDQDWAIGEQNAMDTRIAYEDFLKAHPVKKGDKRVAFLVDNYFVANSSGIFTFLVHMNTLLEKYDIRMDIISDIGYELPEKWDTSNVSFFFMTDYLEDGKGDFWEFDEEEQTDVHTMRSSFENYYTTYRPIVVISNSCVSAWILENYPDINGLHYTHHGDIMAPGKTAYLGLTEKTVRQYVEVLKKAKHPHGSQTQSSVNATQKILNQPVILLPEPYYKPRTIYRHNGDRHGVLMIGSNYTRKNYEQMFEIIAVTGLAAIVVTDKDSELKELARKKGVASIKIIEDIPNEYVEYFIKQARCMLHLSHTEYLPYSVLEAATDIPVIVNQNAPWCSNGDLPFNAIKVDPDDIFGSACMLQEVYGDSFNYLGYDVEEYGEEAEKLWINFLGV